MVQVAASRAARTSTAGDARSQGPLWSPGLQLSEPSQPFVLRPVAVARRPVVLLRCCGLPLLVAQQRGQPTNSKKSSSNSWTGWMMPARLALRSPSDTSRRRRRRSMPGTTTSRLTRQRGRPPRSALCRSHRGRLVVSAASMGHDCYTTCSVRAISEALHVVRNPWTQRRGRPRPWTSPRSASWSCHQP